MDLTMKPCTIYPISQRVIAEFDFCQIISWLSLALVNQSWLLKFPLGSITGRPDLSLRFLLHSLLFLLFLETGFLSVVLAVLELAL